MVDATVGSGLLLALWVASTMSITDIMASLLAFNVWGLMVYRVAVTLWGIT